MPTASPAVAAPEAVSVPVDTSPAVVKFPALAVLLMVRVLFRGRAQQAHAGRPADAQQAARHGAGGRQRGSGDGAGGCERCAGDCARGVHARCRRANSRRATIRQLHADKRKREYLLLHLRRSRPARRPPDGWFPKEKDDDDLRGQPQEGGRLGQRL